MTPTGMAGLYVKTPGATYQIWRKVPRDLIGRLRPGSSSPWLKVSAQTRDPKQAMAARDHQWKAWSAEIDTARGFAPGAGQLSTEKALGAIDAWRRQECAQAALTRPWRPSAILPAWMEQPKPVRALAPTSFSIGRPETLAVQDDVVAAARAYLKRHGDGDEVSGLLMIGRLQLAERDPEGWRQIDGFDPMLDVALEAGGVKVKITVEARAAVRIRFVSAWLEVAQHQEAGRQRARALLSFAELRPDAIRLPDGRAAYQPSAGDRTLGELIRAFRVAQRDKIGDEAEHRKYAHIYKALEQVLGANKPVRAITRKDCYRVRDLFRQLPANATKKFKELSLEEAIDAADTIDLEADGPQEMIARIKPKTVETYMSSLSRVFNWAVNEDDGWCDTNPAKGLAGEEIEQVQRRGFTEGEAAKITGAVVEERERTPWKFWLVVLGNYTGARLTELAQLHREDVKRINGVDLIHITRFDSTGRLAPDKRLKTKSSERLVPIHQDLIDAGFLSFVERAPAGRLFADIPERRGGIGHEPSKWFASLLDRLELTDPCLVYHSWRHGFRNACDSAGVDSDKRRALGGWASKDEADKYGDRHAVKMLSEEIAKLRFPTVRAAIIPGESA